jgi:hypothetical protein
MHGIATRIIFIFPDPYFVLKEYDVRGTCLKKHWLIIPQLKYKERSSTVVCNHKLYILSKNRYR